MSPRRRLVVEADGGSRGNPGVAGFGALVRDGDTGEVLLERAEPLGQASNNVAEYCGLVAGLEGVCRLDPSADVQVLMDSKLVVEQMSGRWRIKHEDMRRLALQAQGLCRRIEAAGGRVSFAWVPRERNRDADALSNAGMDGRSIDRVPAAAPAAGVRIAGTDSPGSPSMGAPTRIVLVRHGVTDNTVAGVLDGRGGSDPPMNAHGHAQARAAAAAVGELVGAGPVRLVTSTLRRAVQTAAAISEVLGLDAQIDPGWDERAFGQWDGTTVAELARRHPATLARMRADPAYRPAGGESRDAVGARVLQALARALDPGGTVVVATSRVPILVVVAHLLGTAPDRFWAPATEPASLTAVDVWDDGPVAVAFLNRTGHLATGRADADPVAGPTRG